MAAALNAKSTQRQDFESETLIVAPEVAASLTRGAESAGKGGYAGRRQEDDSNIVAAYGIRSDASRAGEAITPSADAEGRVRLRNPGFGIYEELSPTLDASMPHSVAFDLRGREGGSQFEGPHETANIRAGSGGSSRSYVAERWAVRRLMPVECERLQGFADGYTLISFRGKPAADGPRYKACGNSMAVPVMRWIGRRIDMVRAI